MTTPHHTEPSMHRVNRFLTDLPTTNARIAVHLGCSVLYVICSLVAGLLDRLPDLEYLIAIGTYLLAMMGIDVTQFVAKRRTHIEPGSAP